MEEKDIKYPGPEPYTRWWWFASKFTDEDISKQLDWLKAQGFGGVEIAFIYPVNRDPAAERFEWLGSEWQEKVVFTKEYCDSIGMGCDFTFGTLWPFGGTFVSDEDRTKVYGDTNFKQPLRLSWTHPDTGNVLDHLNKEAFLRYAKVMGNAFKPALGSYSSALFCDSWEVETRKIWADGLAVDFMERNGYDIIPFLDNILEQGNEGPLYDYMKLVSDKVINEFYIPFSRNSHKLGAYSRVQCAGSPTDLISSYSTVDIPESEAMLFNPHFSRIPASSASLAGKPLVSAETFTCLYGWPRDHIREEKIGDLKLVADALFANGINHIIWHGTPFNPKGVDTIYFYASVHIGERGSLRPHLKDFNKYLTDLSEIMRRGQTWSQAAVYLPVEDSWIKGEMPEELQLPWAWGEYEMRYMEFPDEIMGYSPLWINSGFLEKARVIDQKLVVGKQSFDLLYIDVNYMDEDALAGVLNHAKDGLSVCLKKIPDQAGHMKTSKFKSLLKELSALPNVNRDLIEIYTREPVFTGEQIPDYWCRQDGDSLLVFMTNPVASKLKYPVPYGISDSLDFHYLELDYQYKKNSGSVNFTLNNTQSALLKIHREKGVTVTLMEFPSR